MIIYLAGEPGGSKREREKFIFDMIPNEFRRLQSFFYYEQLLITMEICFERIFLPEGKKE
jgi:hypothetical protein